jgi:hypothetical protein
MSYLSLDESLKAPPLHLLQAASRFGRSYGMAICHSQVLWRNMPEVGSTVELCGKSSGSPENYDQLQEKQCNSHQKLGLLMMSEQL